MDAANRSSSNLMVKEDDQVDDVVDDDQPEPVEPRVGHRDRPWRGRRSTSQEEEQAKHQQDHDRLNREHQSIVSA